MRHQPQLSFPNPHLFRCPLILCPPSQHPPKCHTPSTDLQHRLTPIRRATVQREVFLVDSRVVERLPTAMEVVTKDREVTRVDTRVDTRVRVVTRAAEAADSED